jgi:hypothetical protein
MSLSERSTNSHRRPQDTSTGGESKIPAETGTQVQEGTTIPEESVSEDIQSILVTGETGTGKTFIRASNFENREISSISERDIDTSPRVEVMTEPATQSSYRSLQRFVRNASLTSALLLIVFGLLYLQGAVPVSVTIALGTILLIATAAFGHTWYDLRE